MPVLLHVYIITRYYHTKYGVYHCFNIHMLSHVRLTCRHGININLSWIYFYINVIDKINYNITVKKIILQFISIYYHTMCSTYVIVTVCDPILTHTCCHMIRVCVLLKT